MIGLVRFKEARYCVLGLLVASSIGAACAGAQQPEAGSTGVSSDDASDAMAPQGASEATSDSLFVEVPEGRLRAEAWPETRTERPWAALEEGGELFVTQPEIAAPWRFVFSSRESSLPVRGLWVEFPPGMNPTLRPTAIELRASPTPIEITREAWPSVAPLLRSLGVAELPQTGANGVFVEFEEVERISLLEIRVLGSVGGRQVGLGRVRLVHQRARDESSNLRSVRLRPLDATSSAPEDTGILGIEGASPLPIPSKK